MAERSRVRASPRARALRLDLLLGALLPAIACQSAGAHSSSLRIEQGRANIFPNGSGTAYLTILNPGSAPDRLERSEASWAAQIELHEVIHEGDVVGMRELEGGLPIPPGATLKLEPGGRHLMLEGVTLAAGVRAAPLTLHFAHAGTIRAELSIDSARF
jgi:copper(I)-binding protein